MLFVTILTPDTVQQIRFEQMIRTTAKTENFLLKSIDILGKMDNLSDNLTSHGTHGVYFIDIDFGFPKPEGLLIAQKIRRYDPEATIILLTAHPEMILATFKYKIEAMDFIYTAVTDQALTDHLADIFHEITTYKLKTHPKDTITFENKYSPRCKMRCNKKDMFV